MDTIAGHQYISAGVGWFNKGSGIDFVYRHELGGAEGRLISLTLKLQLCLTEAQGQVFGSPGASVRTARLISEPT